MAKAAPFAPLTCLFSQAYRLGYT